jgi:hypothetical protein
MNEKEILAYLKKHKYTRAQIDKANANEKQGQRRPAVLEVLKEYLRWLAAPVILQKAAEEPVKELAKKPAEPIKKRK